MSSYGHKYKGAGTGIWWVQWEWPYMLIYFNINFPVSRTFLETLRTTDIVGISMSVGVSFVVTKAPATPSLLLFLFPTIIYFHKQCHQQESQWSNYAFLMDVSHSYHHRYFHAWICYECKYFFLLELCDSKLFVA